MSINPTGSVWALEFSWMFSYHRRWERSSFWWRLSLRLNRARTGRRRSCDRGSDPPLAAGPQQSPPGTWTFRTQKHSNILLLQSAGKIILNHSFRMRYVSMLVFDFERGLGQDFLKFLLFWCWSRLTVDVLCSHRGSCSYFLRMAWRTCSWETRSSLIPT